MPSTRVGSGAASNALAWATNARCAVGRDNPWTVAISAGRDLLDGLGEGTAFAVVFPAPPAGLVPPHYDSILPVENVARRGAHLTLHRRGEHPTRRARRRLTRGHRVHHTRVPSAQLDTLDPYAWQPNNSVVPSDTALGFLPSPECFATFRLRKAKASNVNDTLYMSEITTARLRLNGPFDGFPELSRHSTARPPR